MTRAVILSAVRTPIGRYGGGLAAVRPDDLAAIAIAEAVARAGVPAEQIEDVWLGCANQAGEDNRNVARFAALLAGLPDSVGGVTVNRLCASGLAAVVGACHAVIAGDGDLFVAGGVESMTRAPWVLPKPARAFPAGHETLISTTLGWRLVNPRMPEQFTASLGECNEQLADELGIGRDRQDAFAVVSHQRAAQGWADGFYDDLVLPVGGLERDEGVRPDASAETLAGLQPAFRPGGTITAGNASPLNDGAAALLVAAEGVDLGLGPLARVAGRGAAALEPQRFGIAPVEAADRALAAAGIGWPDVGAVELNEAFAVQSLACLDAWKIDPDIVNTRGGAIAIGHPLGASGARVIGTLAQVLIERRERWGVAAICIGVGQGLAVVLENVASV